MMTGTPLLYPFKDRIVIPRNDFDFSVNLRDVLDEDFQLEEGGVCSIFHETRCETLRGLRREVKKEEERPSNSRGTALVSSRRVKEPFGWVSHVHPSISIDAAKVSQNYQYLGYVNYDLTFFNIVRLISSDLYFYPREVMLSRIFAKVGHHHYHFREFTNMVALRWGRL